MKWESHPGFTGVGRLLKKPTPEELGSVHSRAEDLRNLPVNPCWPLFSKVFIFQSQKHRFEYEDPNSERAGGQFH